MILATVFLGVVGTQQAAPAPECRESSYTTADGRQGSVRYCKDSAGVWRRVAGVNLPQPPFPYRSQVTFRGVYQLTVTQAGRPMRRLDLNSLLKSGGTSQRLEGAITITANFDGLAAVATISGTGGIAPVRLSGINRNGACRLVDDRQTVVYEGRCGQDGFKGTIKGQHGQRTRFEGGFDAPTTQIRDLDER